MNETRRHPDVKRSRRRRPGRLASVLSVLAWLVCAAAAFSTGSALAQATGPEGADTPAAGQTAASAPSAAPVAPAQVVPPPTPIVRTPQTYEMPPPPERGRRLRVRDSSNAPQLTVGVGLGLGFLLDSSDQTRFIENWQNAQADIVIQTEGFSDILLYFLPRLALSYSPFRWGRLQAIFEYGWGPKYIDVRGGSSRFFSYNRVSAGLLASLEIPVAKHRLKAFDIGAGPLFHHVMFEGNAGSALGVKVQASTFLRVGQKNQMEIYLAYDYAPASAKTMVLDYSSVSFGFVYHLALLTRN